MNIILWKSNYKSHMPLATCPDEVMVVGRVCFSGGKHAHLVANHGNKECQQKCKGICPLSVDLDSSITAPGRLDM